MSSWHDTDPFWVDFHDVMFHRRRWELAEEEAEAVIRLASIDSGTQILDMCCGPGRHSLAFAQRGYNVVGVDRTSAYIDQARERATQAGLDVTFEVGDARSYQAPDRFGAAVCLYTSFGYFEEQEEDLALLRNICSSLKAGGVFAIDMNGKEVAARAYKGRSWEEMENGTKLLEERTVGPDWAWIENKWTVVEDGVERETRFRVRMYSGMELRRALEEAGFREVDLYGDWTGTPYDDQARRLIAIARK
jgi:SAM-dependent methyltransferase